MKNQAMSVLTSQATNEWYTPYWILKLVWRTMGGIDLDPASNPIAQRVVNAKQYYTKYDDGLSRDWSGRVFLNPPFDDARKWVWRLASDYEDRKISQAILLVNSAPGYNWWEALWRAYPVCMLKERIHFIKPDGTTIGAAKKGTTIAYFGPSFLDFNRIWSEYGRVIRPDGLTP